jgi:hypothetical protein
MLEEIADNDILYRRISNVHLKVSLESIAVIA